MKQTPWLTVMQIVGLVLLCVDAIWNAATDHGVLMAINCFCLGFLASCLLASRFMARMSLAMGVQSRVIIDMAHQITQMTEERFPSIQPSSEADRDGPTKH